MIRSLVATRYLQPLREGGSLPAVVEVHGGELFVLKFRGAGQGARALVAELIVGLLATELDLPVPELASIDLLPTFGRTEPDPEIQDLLRASVGTNVGIRYLDGAFNFSPAAAGDLVDEDLASRVVWLDAFLTNPDRTHRNPNLLVWQGKPWLIDHGAALYAHHDWPSVNSVRTRAPFPLVESHVLLAQATQLAAADAALAPQVTDDMVRRVLDSVPDNLLTPDTPATGEPATPEDARDRYALYLRERLTAPRAFVDEAVAAHERLLRQPPLRRPARR